MSVSGMREEQIPPAPLFQRGSGHAFWKTMREPMPLPTSFGIQAARAVPPFEKGGQGGFALRASVGTIEEAHP